ncbi:DUF397 domain-containing protein [Actinacidiphila paucisporea]
MKSTYSGGQGGECVEVADGFAVVPVRDSKDTEGPAWFSRRMPGPRSSPT